MSADFALRRLRDRERELGLELRGYFERCERPPAEFRAEYVDVLVRLQEARAPVGTKPKEATDG